MSATAAGPRSDDRLMLAVLIASALHVLLIFGVTFDAWRPTPGRQQVEVTLLQTTSAAPTEARHIAEADQRGSGEEALRDLPAGQQAALPSAAAAPAQRPGREHAGTAVLASPRGERRVSEDSGDAVRAENLPATERELARLNQRLAELEASLDQPYRPRSAQPRVRRLDAVSARAAVDAAYLADWRRRVESVGNQYYPQASLRYGIFGKLRLLVTVRASGELEDVRLLESSGHAVLDEAAIRIVRLAAPFPPFPTALAATTDKLEIVRTWQFEQNALSSK